MKNQLKENLVPGKKEKSCARYQNSGMAFTDFLEKVAWHL